MLLFVFKLFLKHFFTFFEWIPVRCWCLCRSIRINTQRWWINHIQGALLAIVVQYFYYWNAKNSKFFPRVFQGSPFSVQHSKLKSITEKIGRNNGQRWWINHIQEAVYWPPRWQFSLLKCKEIQNSFHWFSMATLSWCSTQSSSQSQKKLDEIMVNADEIITYKGNRHHRNDIFHYWNAKKFRIPSTDISRQPFLGATLKVRVKSRKNRWNFAKATANPTDKLPEAREVFKYQVSLKSIKV